MELIATATASARNGYYDSSEPGFADWSARADHTVRFAAAHVTAVASVSMFWPPWFPYSAHPERDTLHTGVFALVSGYRDAVGGGWVDLIGGNPIDTLNTRRIDDCSAVTFSAIVGQGWATITGLVFFRGLALHPPDVITIEHNRLVFDERTGFIVHSSTVSALEGADPLDFDPDEAALDAARTHAPEGAALAVLRVEEPLPADRSFRVDPDSGRLVELRPRRGA